MRFKELLKIPKEYNTTERKLKFLEELTMIQNDSFDMDYIAKLYHTTRYYQNLKQ